MAKLLSVKMRDPDTGEEREVSGKDIARAKKLGLEVVMDPSRSANMPMFTPSGQSLGSMNINTLLHLPVMAGAAGGGALGGLAGTAAMPMAPGLGTYLGAGIGAGIGGAAGRSIERPMRESLGMAIDPDAAGDIAKEGAAQAAMEIGGRGLAQGAAGATKFALQRWVPREVQRQFGDVAGAIIRRKLPAYWFGQEPNKRALEALGESGKVLDSILAQADAAGLKITAREMSQQVINTLEQQEGRALTRQEVANAVRAVRFKIAELRSASTGNIIGFGPKTTYVPSEAKRIKKFAGDAAKQEGIYRASAKAEPKIGLQEAADIASGAKAGLENLGQGFGPRIAEREGITEELIGVKQALNSMQDRPIPATPIATTNPAHLGLWYLMRYILANPGLISRAAISAADPDVQFMLRQSPRVFSNENY